MNKTSIENIVGIARIKRLAIKNSYQSKEKIIVKIIENEDLKTRINRRT